MNAERYSEELTIQIAHKLIHWVVKVFAYLIILSISDQSQLYCHYMDLVLHTTLPLHNQALITNSNAE